MRNVPCSINNNYHPIYLNSLRIKRSHPSTISHPIYKTFITIPIKKSFRPYIYLILHHVIKNNLNFSRLQISAFANKANFTFTCYKFTKKLSFQFQLIAAAIR